MNIDQTISALEALPVRDRVLVIQKVWDALPADAEIPITPEQQAELKHRLAAHQADPASAISGEELKRRLRER